MHKHELPLLNNCKNWGASGKKCQALGSLPSDPLASSS